VHPGFGRPINACLSPIDGILRSHDCPSTTQKLIRQNFFKNFAPPFPEKDGERTKHMKTITKFQLAFIALLAFLPLRLATAADCYTSSPGCLDTTFGGGTGKVLVDISPGTDPNNARAVAIQADGKIVTAGSMTDPANSGNLFFAILRFNTDGSLDSSFGNGGLVTTSFFTGRNDAFAVALQADGKIVAAGRAPTAYGYDFAIARYNPFDGSLDSTFGNGGKRTVSFSGRKAQNSEARAVAVQADGKIVVGGYVSTSAMGSSGGLARLNSDGSLDSTFGSGGKITNSMQMIWGLVIQAGGKIVAGGSANVRHRGSDFALIRHNANGTVDTTFGNSGMVTTDFFGSDDAIRELTSDGNGNLIAAGQASQDFGLARYTPNGLPDSTFGNGGKATTDIFANSDQAYGVAVQSNGQIVAAGIGYMLATSTHFFTLVRYNSNGTLDTTFGSGGIVTTNIAGGTWNIAHSVAIQADGKIVAGGSASTPSYPNGSAVVLARYLP
jgi:uncharacterized delta-60 repeat protein